MINKLVWITLLDDILSSYKCKEKKGFQISLLKEKAEQNKSQDSP